MSATNVLREGSCCRRRSCTCAEPPDVVDLTDAYYHLRCHGGDDDDDDKHNSSLWATATTTSTAATSTAETSLRRNLRDAGWSPVSLNVTEMFRRCGRGDGGGRGGGTGTGTTTVGVEENIPLILRHHRHWKDMVAELFDTETVHGVKTEQQQQRQRRFSARGEAADAAVVAYRAAESGAAGTVVPEPKESWEVSRCTCGCGVIEVSVEEEDDRRITTTSRILPGNDDDDRSGSSTLTFFVRDRLLSWTDVAHSLLVTVRTLLRFPKSILLQEQQCCTETSGDTNSSSSNSNKNGCWNSDGTTFRRSCSVDLLRAFYYDTVKDTTTNTTKAISDQGKILLGSSPHTDWGSFTVVWQDHVGGLETYCHCCNTWVAVPTGCNKHNNDVVVHGSENEENDENDDNSNDDDWVHFILHVGDVTSLAVGRALQQQQQRNENNETATVQQNEGAQQEEVVLWPSPRHRVVSPTGTEKRASLVYFSYPPPAMSLQNMTDALVASKEDWQRQRQQQQTTQEEGEHHHLDDDDGGDKGLIRRIHVPYDDYFLLKDQQGQQVTGRHRTAEERFESIASMPLKYVFEEKWNQVQRK